MGFLFFIASFIAFKLYFILFGTTAKPRTELTHQPFHKLYWFLRIELPLSLNFWHLMDSSKRALTLGVTPLGVASLLIDACWSAFPSLRSRIAADAQPHHRIREKRPCRRLAESGSGGNRRLAMRHS